MKIRFSSALTIVLLGVIVFSLGGNVTPAQASSTLCNAAQFVADVSIPDGTYIDPGGSFTKTWRLKNVGTCSWSTSYALVFSSGERMGGASPINLARFVSPGQTVDVSVTLTAPVYGGTFRGNWQLQNGSGTRFGVGGAAANPFWVQIRVLGPTTSVVGYDFIQNMCSALWVYDGGPIPCPVNLNKTQFGYVQRVDNPTLENGAAAGAPALLTVPQDKFNGVIQGIFTVDDIFRGDHFQAIIGCQYGAVNCAVTYQLDYGAGTNFVTLWKFKEQYDGLYEQVDIDLSPIANVKNAKIVLSVYAAGSASGDFPLWVSPRIVRNVQSPIITPTPIPPTPTPVPTATPLPTACTNRAQFVTDVTVPDGTTFAPNSSFFKVWRLKNVGTCTWDTAYDLTFVSGTNMGGSDAPLPQSVLPGQTVDAGVNLIAPSAAGHYRGFWELKNGSGQIFGIGSSFNQAFWVDINVAGTPVSTPTPTVAPSTPTASATATSVVLAGWSTYQNGKYLFSFQFPPGSTLTSQSDNAGHIDLPILTAGTNLGQKYVDVSVVEGAPVCQTPEPINPGSTSQNVTINGIQFLKQTGEGNATSNVWDWTSYSTVKGTACISLTFTLHSVSLGAFATPPPAFDPVAESAVFSTIMTTYANH